MIKVDFLGPIGLDSLEIDIKNLKELKVILKNKNIDEWLDISSVAVNSRLVTNLDIELKSGDVISILPPVCGG